MRSILLAVCVVLTSAAGACAEEFHADAPPFRVTVLSLHRQRDVMLVRGPWIWVDDHGAQRPIAGRTPQSRTPGAPDCFARLRITATPPIAFRQAGPPRLDEAVDDLDQTLEPFEDPAGKTNVRGVPNRSAHATCDVRLGLSLPEQPGKTIKVLKGVIPVELTARSAAPRSVLDLSRASGERLRVGDARLSVTDVRIEPDGAARVKLLVTLPSEKGKDRDKEYQQGLAARLIDVVERQIDLVDDQSRVVRSYATTHVRRNEARATLEVRPDAAFGAPDRLRVWELMRATRDVAFEFKNVPLP